MACSLSHTIEEIKAIIYKQFEKDNVRQQAMMNWVVQFENASITKDDTRKAYEECNDIQQEKRADLRNTGNMMLARNELLQSMTEKEEFIRNYRGM
ncbi:hypothetical protein Tco_1272382 [Tanacetum coccineum]